MKFEPIFSPFAVRIYTSAHIPPYFTATLPRTYRERFLSWPWRPWIKTKKVQTKDPIIYEVGDGLMVNPVHLSAIKLQLETAGAEFVVINRTHENTDQA